MHKAIIGVPVRVNGVFSNGSHAHAGVITRVFPDSDGNRDPRNGPVIVNVTAFPDLYSDGVKTCASIPFVTDREAGIKLRTDTGSFAYPISEDDEG